LSGLVERHVHMDRRKLTLFTLLSC
jgi:hypothetical protein